MLNDFIFFLIGIGIIVLIAFIFGIIYGLVEDNKKLKEMIKKEV
jgi:hypothetical protein